MNLSKKCKNSHKRSNPEWVNHGWTPINTDFGSSSVSIRVNPWFDKRGKRFYLGFAMKKLNFNEALIQILAEDPRYDEQAYHFMKEALDFTIKLLAKPIEGPGRHVKGAELLEGIRQYALQEYGPVTLTVLNRWGVRKCEDFGEIVFNMVSKGVLGKTEEDRKEDFAGGYDFESAFRKPFRPRAKVPAPNVTSNNQQSN